MHERPIRISILTFFLAALLIAVGASMALADEVSEMGIEATDLGRLAAQVAPGEFSVLETGMPDGVVRFSQLLRGSRPDGSGAPAIDTWTDSGHWDPERKRTFFMGLRQSNRFLSLDAVSNTWREISLDGDHAPPLFERFGHMYGRTALDWKRGHYYRLAGSTLHRYLVDEDRWERFENSPIGGYISIEWHYGRDMLVGLAGHELHGFRDGQWFSLGSAAVHGYHSSAQYNPVRNDMLFIGGNHSRQNVDILDAHGRLHRMADAPFGFGISQDNLTYDPLSGNYLVLHRDRRLWEYNPDLDEWKVARDFSESSSGWPFGGYWAVVPIPIDELGVIFWQNSRGPHLYRHEAVLSGQSKAKSWVDRRGSTPVPPIDSPWDSPDVAPPSPEKPLESKAGEPAAADPRGSPVASPPRELAPVHQASDLTGSMIRAMRPSPGGVEPRREDLPAAPVSARAPPGLSASTVRALRSGEVELEDLQASRGYAPPPRAAQLELGKQVASTDPAPATPGTQPRSWKPAPVAPGPTDSLLLREAATMQPGEWRNIAHLTTWPGKDDGRTFFAFQRVSGTASDGSGVADGIGWTQRLVYHKGGLLILAMRDASPVGLIGMHPDGTFWRVDAPEGFEGPGGRRPFNRLTQDTTHVYFSITRGVTKEDHGRTLRTPLDNPGVFEDSGHHGFGQSNIDSVGNHAILWVEEWGRFYGYTPGGRIWTRTPEDDGWTDLGRTPYDGTCRASGYAGEIAYNPIEDEVIFIGGQHFGSPRGCGTKWVRLQEPLGEIEALPDLPEINGEQLRYTSAQGKIFVDPRDGAYLLQVGRERIYRASNALADWTLYIDLYEDAGKPFHFYDSYAPLALIPGTDVYVFLSHIRGVVLHRLRE